MNQPLIIGACVYLMHNEYTGKHKIGYTTQMPEKRKAQIESPAGNPFNTQIKLDVLAVILCESEDIAKYVEARLHADGYANNTQSQYGKEWFMELTDLQYHAFYGRIDGVWGWRHVVEYLELEIAQKDVEMEQVKHTAEGSEAEALWIAENLIHAVKHDDMDTFWFFANKRQSRPQQLLTN